MKHSRTIIAGFMTFAIGASLYFSFNRDTILSSHLRQSFTATRSAIVETDARGKIIAASDELCDMTGFSRKEMLGHSITLIMEPGTKAHASHGVGFAESPHATVIHTAIVGRTGQRVPVLVVARVAGGIYIATLTPLELVTERP